MYNFKYYTPTKVLFGKETEKQVGELVKAQNCKKVLIHYGILKESFEFIDFITIFLRSILLPIGSIIGVNLRK